MTTLFFPENLIFLAGYLENLIAQQNKQRSLSIICVYNLTVLPLSTIPIGYDLVALFNL